MRWCQARSTGPLQLLAEDLLHEGIQHDLRLLICICLLFRLFFPGSSSLLSTAAASGSCGSTICLSQPGTLASAKRLCSEKEPWSAPNVPATCCTCRRTGSTRCSTWTRWWGSRSNSARCGTLCRPCSGIWTTRTDEMLAVTPEVLVDG